MFTKHSLWKVLTTLAVTIITVIFGSGSSKASVKPDNLLSETTNQSTIERRIARIREALIEKEQHSLVASHVISSEPDNSQINKDEELMSQYWDNWNNSTWQNTSWNNF